MAGAGVAPVAARAAPPPASTPATSPVATSPVTTRFRFSFIAFSSLCVFLCFEHCGLV